MVVITTLIAAFWTAVNLVPQPVVNLAPEVLIAMVVSNLVVAVAALRFYYASRPPRTYRDLE